MIKISSPEKYECMYITFDYLYFIDYHYTINFIRKKASLKGLEDRFFLYFYTV